MPPAPRSMGTCEVKIALPSRLEVRLPADIHSQIGKTMARFIAFNTRMRFEQIRADIAKVPIEESELLRICGTLGIPVDFDLITILSSTNNSLAAHERSIHSTMSTSLT